MSGSERASANWSSDQTGQVLHEGRVLVGRDFTEYCERNGLCKKCGKVRTKEKKKSVWGITTWTDIPERRDDQGQYTVYKGYCISPTCYTLKQVKEYLGESDDPPQKKEKKPRKRENPTVIPPDTFKTQEADFKPSTEEILDAEVTGINDEDTQSSGENQKMSVSSSETERTASSSGQEPNEFRTPSPRTAQSQREAFATLQHKSRPATLSADTRYSRAQIRSSSLDDTHDAKSLTLPSRLFISAPDLTKKLHHSAPPIMPPHPIPEESPDDVAIRELEEEVSKRDAYQFLMKLDLKRQRPVVVQRGLQLLRQLVFETHREDPEKRYIFPQDSWCKTIKCAMSDHSQDQDIQEESAKTVAFMASFSPRYKADLLRNLNANEIITALERDHQLGEICCMALETLTQRKGTRVPWRGEVIEHAVKALTSFLSDPSSTGKEWAILALHNISCDETLPEEFIFEQIYCILSHNSVITSFAMVMQDDAAPENVVEAAVTLLWRFSVAPENIDGDFEEPPTIPSSDDLLCAIITAMYSFRSEALHEATCGLLSSIDIPLGSADSESISWKQTLSDAVWSSLTGHATAEAVQLAGLRALFHIFCDREESVADLDRNVEAIIFAMNNFQGNVDLQAHGCQALACICESGDLYKATVTSRGGITTIADAFRSHVVNGNYGAERQSAIDRLRDGASAVLASLALSNTAVPMLQESNLLLDFQKFISRDGLPPVGSSVRTCVVNLIAASLLESDDSSVGSGVSNENTESGYIILANMATQFLQGGNEGEVQSLITSLHIMSSRESGVLDVILSAANGTGNAQLVNRMQEYPANASIQESGCGILGNIYFSVPFQGELDQSSEVVVGPEVFTVKTHTSQEVAVMRAALVKHKTKAGVVKNACSALCNFVSGLMLTASSSEDAHLDEEVALLYSGVCIEVDHALAIHEDILETQKSALRLAHAAVTFVGEEELQRCSGNLIAKIYENMSRYPDDQEIHENACSVLARFVSVEKDSIDDSLGNEDGLRALLHSLRSDNELVVQYATAIISALLQRVFNLPNAILDIDGYIDGEGYFDALIGCIYRFPDSMAIQTQICLILASLATLNEVYVKTVIANHGGVSAILDVMKCRRGNAHVQECACKALSGIAQGIPDSILLPIQARVCKELMRTFNSFENAEGIQRAILEALCELCERNPEYFVSTISQSNGIPLIVAAMSQNLKSEDIQKAGCKLFWMLARENDDNKLALTQKGGVQATILAMMSHITATAVQKEALTALKHISKISESKEVLHRDDAMGAVRLSICGNLEEPFVVCAALSALNDIAVDDRTHKVATVSEDVLSCVLRAMRTHPLNRDVQKIGCWLLRSYTFNRKNLSMMRAEQEKLFELLPAASSAFPEDCAERAQYILGKI